jgi:hypothetical protein
MMRERLIVSPVFLGNKHFDSLSLSRALAGIEEELTQRTVDY